MRLWRTLADGRLEDAYINMGDLVAVYGTDEPLPIAAYKNWPGVSGTVLPEGKPPEWADYVILDKNGWRYGTDDDTFPHGTRKPGES